MYKKYGNQGRCGLGYQRMRVISFSEKVGNQKNVPGSARVYYSSFWVLLPFGPSLRSLKLFNQITKDPAHKLSSLFPARSSITHDLRNIRDFQEHVIKTDRFLKTFIPSCIKEFS